MNLCRSWICLVGLAFWLPISPAAAQRLHAIVVGETDSPQIGMPIGLSINVLVTLLNANTPSDRLNLTVLTGDKYSRRNILDTIDALQAGPDDAILYYFCGHGFYDKTQGTHFKPPKDSRYLLLSEIRRPLREKQTRLVVTIADCCSGSPVRLYAAPTPREILQPEEVSALFDQLFWQSSGNLVVNSSAPGQYAVVRLGEGQPGEPGIGALFTNVLVGTLKKHRDERLTWDEIVGECRTGVDESFRRLHPNGTIRLGPSRVVQQSTQTVWGLKDGERWFPFE